VESAPSLARADALREAAEAAVARTRMELLPRLELSARYTHIDGFPDGRVGGTGGAPSIRVKIPRNQTGFGARLTWQVSDMFFAMLPALEAAGESARASEAQVAARTLRVRLSARESFYQLARARGNLAVAERAVTQAQAQAQRIEAGVRAGLRTPADGASAAARVASAQQAVALAATAVDVADASLRTLLADADGPVYGIAEPVLGEVDGPELAAAALMVQRARVQRPEIRALEASLAARHKALSAQDASGYPHLAVYAAGDYANPNRYVIPPQAEFRPSWEVGASLIYAPNDTLLAVRRKGESTAQIRALEADLAELLRGLELEVRTARASVARSGQSIEAARAAAVAAEAAYAQRNAELAAGEVTLADVFSAESELNAARLRLLDAAIEQLVQRARLAYALGAEPEAI
jgi:outer membrane protein TolC